MATFNIEDAARQGRSATLPAAWSKFPAARSAIQTTITIYTVGALLLYALAAYLLINGTLPGGTRGDDSFAPVELVVLFLCGCFFLALGLRLIPALLHSKQYFCLLTGDGFVYVADKKLMGLPLADIRIAYRQAGLLGGKLVVRQQSGSALNVPLGHLFAIQTVREIEETLNARVTAPGKSKPGKRA